MPKVGFKSITVNGKVYDRFHKIYQAREDSLSLMGINSFAGFLTAVIGFAVGDDESCTAFLDKMFTDRQTQWRKANLDTK